MSKPLLEVSDLLFLLGQEVAEAQRVGEHHALVIPAAQLQAEGKGAAEERERQPRNET